MNRYVVIDFEKLEILSLNKVEMNFKENDNFTSSVNCNDKIDFVKTINDEVFDNLIRYLDLNK